MMALPIWLPALWRIIKANWKIIVIVLVAIALYFAVTRWIAAVKEEAYNSGVTAERTIWNERTRIRNEENRRLERVLDARLVEFGQRFASEERVRMGRETVHINTIRELVRQLPDMQTCQAPPEVIEQRNAIRRMGPTQ